MTGDVKYNEKYTKDDHEAYEKSRLDLADLVGEDVRKCLQKQLESNTLEVREFKEEENESEYYNKELLQNYDQKFINVDGFHYEQTDTKESYFRKILSNNWGLIINWSINLGNHHFAITINGMNSSKDGKEFEYDSFGEDYWNDHKNIIKDIIFNSFPTTTFVLIVAEKNKKGNLHFHIIVAIRNFIDYNYTMRINLTNVLIDNLDLIGLAIKDYDIKVESLRYFKDIKNWVMYLHKDMYKWKYPAILYVIQKYKREVFTSYLGNLISFYLQINLIIEAINDNKYVELYGVMLNHNKLEEDTILYLCRYYLILNDIYLENDNIYKKIKGLLISYEYVGTVKEVLYDNFVRNVVLFYMKEFEYYFKGFNFDYLTNKFLIKNKYPIKSLGLLTNNKIKLNFGLIEFKDGVYSIKYNRFFPKNGLDRNFSSRIATVKYYDIKWNTARQTKPKNWIKGLKSALNIEKDENFNEDFKNVCLYIINVIHKDIFDKKLTLFVHGESNTGKTTLITDILVNYFGINNVGSAISSKNFKWQDLINKIVAILDEGRYDPSMSSDLLKITAGENIIVEKKYAEEHTNIEQTPVFILTNERFNDKNESINSALNNRMCTVEFYKNIKGSKFKKSKLFKKKLKEEELYILLYCNRLLFKTNKVHFKNTASIDLINEIENDINKKMEKGVIKEIESGVTSKYNKEILK